MVTLFSYRIRWDDGAAPNPFGGLCTLVICKPGIRLAAKEGDWIAGTGAVTSGLPDPDHRLVYAMKVTRKMTMAEYDTFASRNLTIKVPSTGSKDRHRKVGDSVYDFSTNPPGQRKGVHGEENRATDLAGENALLSDHFYYWGRNAIPLPRELWPIIKRGRGERSRTNEPYVDRFVAWIEMLGPSPGSVLGDPIIWPPTPASCAMCARGRGEEEQE